MIRAAKLADLDAIVELAVVSVSRDPLPVTIDRAAMREMARSLIGHPAHFIWVSEIDGLVKACVAACVQVGFWFRGTQASVLLFVSDGGEGAQLLVRFARWVKSRPAIKLAVFELEPDVDPRIENLLRRLGFTRASTNLTYVRAAPA